MTSLLGAMLLGFTSTSLNAEDIKKVLAEKSYPVNQSPTLTVNHEFGEVTCKNWDKQEISVKITGIAKTSNSEKAETAFKRIQYTLEGNKDAVKVICKLGGNNNGQKPDVSINVEIFMPQSINLELEHQFGSAFIGVVDGNGIISSEYGNLKVNSLSGPDSKIKIGFGEGHINTFGGKNINVSYSKFSVENVGDFAMKGEYSEIEVTVVGILNLTQEGGECNISRAVSVSGTSNMSSLNIGRLEKKLDIKTSYGSLNIEKVDPGFTEINVTNDYGSANIYIPAEALYSIDATIVYGSLNYPESLANFTYREKTTSKSIYRGIIGKGDSPNSKVTLYCDYGSVNMKSK